MIEMKVKLISDSYYLKFLLLCDSKKKFNLLYLKIGIEFIFDKKDFEFKLSHLDYLKYRRKINQILRDNNITLDQTFLQWLNNIRNNTFDNLEEKIISPSIFQETIKTDFKRTLKDYQLKNVINLLRFNSGATFSVPGGGKTSEILSLFCYHRIINKDLKILVICPKNAVSAWDEELPLCFSNTRYINKGILDKFQNNFTGRMAFLSGGEENIKLILQQSPSHLIITFDTLRNNIDSISSYVCENQIFCAIDESHRIKNFKGVTAKSVLKLSSICKFKYIMSGTPMPQDKFDLISQFNFLFPEKNADAQGAFNGIQDVYVRTTKKDIGLKPAKIEYIDVKMSNKHQELYDTIHKQYKRDFLRSDIQLDLKKIRRCVMRLLQISSNPRIIEDKKFEDNLVDLGLEDNLTESSTKYKKACDLIEDLTSKGEKVLVWTSFKRNIDLLKEDLSYLNPVVIDGRVDTGEIDIVGTRKGNIEKFKNDKTCMLFIANPAAASEGISLHINKNGEKVCSHAIYLDRNYNCGQYLQSLDRIHRIGCKTTPNIYILRTIDSIDQKVQEGLDKKVNNLIGLLNDKSLYPMPGLEGNIFDFEEINTAYSEQEYLKLIE